MSEKLPPGTRCVVCDDIATGNHYSVPSCNGCKTFFRRALVNNRQFTCSGNGNCPVNKGVRCACRYCRLQKCLQVGMDKNAIQSDRDRIGYTKRTRKNEKNRTPTPEPDDQETRYSSGDNEMKDFKPDGGFSPVNVDPILERLTQLENNFTLLLSRGEIEPYDTLDDALNAPSRFSSPINIRLNDPIAYPNSEKEHQPFWRSRIIALYIDWAKTFSCFRKLPYSDKVALINNHASSYLIMCEVFRTPEHIEEIEDCLTKVIGAPGGSSTVMSVVLNNEVAKSFATALEMKTKVKREPSEAMIRLPTEYGSLPPDYGQWIPEDYGTPSAGTEGCPDMHKLFNNNMTPSPGYGSNGNGTSLRPPFPRFSDFSATELTPVMAAMIEYMMKPFRQLNISTTEFAALQSVMFFDPDTDGLDAASQRNVEAEQQRLLAALHRHLVKNYNLTEANERYSNILLRIPTIRKVAAKKNESLQMIDMLNLFSLNSLVKETALGPRGARSANNILFE